MNKKLVVLIVFAILFMLIGIGFLLYPKISNYFYEKDVQKQKDDFIVKIEKIESEAESTNNEDKSNILDELYNLLKQENENLYKNHQSNLTDPFSYEQSAIDLSKYGISNNTIGFLRIPKMEIEVPILLGVNKANMLKGAVHLTETSYPIGGENTNSVIAAHRGYGKATLFRHIEKLEKGDRIYIQNFREELVYEVYEIKIILPTEVGELLIEDGKDIITLLSCHPYRINSHRYVVKAQRVVE